MLNRINKIQANQLRQLISNNDDIEVLRSLLKDALQKERVASDTRMDLDAELVSKGQRQALSATLRCLSKDWLEGVLDKLKRSEK